MYSANHSCPFCGEEMLEPVDDLAYHRNWDLDHIYSKFEDGEEFLSNGNYLHELIFNKSSDHYTFTQYNIDGDILINIFGKTGNYTIVSLYSELFLKLLKLKVFL